MGLITPDLGLVFWTTLSFLIVLFILGKFAWKPMLAGLKEREESITSALEQAETARKEMDNLKNDNEKLLQEARAERDKMLTEARETREAIVAKAESEAKEKGDRLVAKAKEEIQNEKLAAQTEIKNMVANLSIEIAEKIVKSQLSDNDKQKALVDSMIDDVILN